MLVSVIIPVYNGEKYIKEAIDSVLNQTYKNIEILVVNDGSTDGTAEIIRIYEGAVSGFHYIEHKKNLGVAAALNTGIENTGGIWIKWLSADDILRRDAVEKLINFVKEDRYNWRKTIYYTHYHRIDENGRVIAAFVEPVRPESDLWKFYYGNGSSTIIHRDVFKLCGLFDERYRHSEDYEFWLRATQVFGVKLKLINEYTLMYRNHPGQLTLTVGGQLDEQIKDTIRQRITEIKH